MIAAAFWEDPASFWDVWAIGVVALVVAFVATVGLRRQMAHRRTLRTGSLERAVQRLSGAEPYRYRGGRLWGLLGTKYRVRNSGDDSPLDGSSNDELW